LFLISKNQRRNSTMKHSRTVVIYIACLLLLAAGIVTILTVSSSQSVVNAQSDSIASRSGARKNLERALTEATAAPAKDSANKVDEAFAMYEVMTAAKEADILRRINELASAGRPRGHALSYSGSGGGVSDNRLKPDNSDQAASLDAEYVRLNGELENLRAESGAVSLRVMTTLAGIRGSAIVNGAAGCNVLIINGASTTSESGTTADATNTLSGIITAQGGAVTIADTVPASLAGFNSVYDLRFSISSPISAADTTKYLSFLQAGGSLLVVGENAGFTDRNNSIITFVGVAGGGPLTYCTQPFDFIPGTCTDATICSTPNAVGFISLPAPGATTNSGNGTPIVKVPDGCDAVSVFRPGQLSNAPAGKLITFFDINTFQSGFSGGNDNLKLIANIVNFFCSSCTAAPTINCPTSASAVAGAACPASNVATVTFSVTATSNCGGTVSVICSPPSGSTFPVGTSTVSCSATDSSGNTSFCSFPVTVFSGCLADDSNPGNVVVYNAQTGQYRFCCNGVLIASGTGVRTIKGCVLTIAELTPERKVRIQADTAANSGFGSGTANLSINNIPQCAIIDKKMAGDVCICP
jgi:hypothetical protein